MTTRDENDVYPRLAEAGKALGAINVEACVSQASNKAASVDDVVEDYGLRPLR